MKREQNTGCFLDGSRGWRIAADVIALAERYGYRDKTDAELQPAILCFRDEGNNCGEYTCFCAEIVLDGTDNALGWLNDNVAMPNHSFGFNDGAFFHMLNSWWSEA